MMNLQSDISDQKSIGTSLEIELNNILLSFHCGTSVVTAAEGSSSQCDQFIDSVMNFVNGVFTLKCAYIGNLVAMAVKFVDRVNFEASFDTSLYKVWKIIIKRRHDKEEK